MIRFSFWKNPSGWGLKKKLEGGRVTAVAKTKDAGNLTRGLMLVKQRQGLIEEMDLKVISEMRPRRLGVLDWICGETEGVVKGRTLGCELAQRAEGSTIHGDRVSWTMTRVQGRWRVQSSVHTC